MMMNRKKNIGWVVAGVLSGALVMSPMLPASAAAEKGTETAARPAVSKTVEGVDAPYETESSASETGKHTKTQWEQDEEAKVVKERATKPTHTWEIQAEYLEGRFFKERHIDDYNIHIYRKYRDVNDISVWYGGTLSRPVGYTTEDGIYRDSEAIGLGPSMMLRWERPLVGKLTGSIDGTGSLLFYNQAHPGDGRAYGFLWRIGPRLLYHATGKDAVSLAYLFHHSSNGMHHHNPGYNGVGFSLGASHTF
ncbi:MAG: hypothetical protein PUB60_11935 [Veillonellaceae bacterium]|nr:hypothetical protein [Veillonellaceae bacterium]